MMDYHEELFPQIPVVFFGINDLERAEKAAENPYFTGMLEKFSMAETIEIAKKFNPQARKVVGIVDSTLTGQGDQGQFLATKNNKVMDSLIMLAHSLKLKITAEGIEEWDQYLQLKCGGCDFIQGYLFSKPLDSLAAEEIFNKIFVLADDHELH